MKILIIEDDSNKMTRISNYIKDIYDDIHINEARSYRSGVSKLMSGDYDFILLDMSLPTYDISPDEDGFQVDAYAGRKILDEMARKGVSIPTVVITMFETFGEGDELMTLEELDDSLKNKYSTIYRGSIYYNSSEINWKDSLKKQFEELK